MCNMSCHVPRVELPKKPIKVAKIEWVLILTYVATRGVICFTSASRPRGVT